MSAEKKPTNQKVKNADRPAGKVTSRRRKMLDFTTEDIRSNRHVLTDYFDLDYVTSLTRNVLGFLDQNYFRSRLIGFDELPERPQPKTPVLYASNHSGMSFPWDGIIFGSRIFRQGNYDISAGPRALTAPALSHFEFMEPFGLPHFWKRAGGVDASLLNFETIMEDGNNNVLIYPEGVAGIGKGFDHKYQLQRFSTSFIRMALKHKTDIIPVATVNAEYSNPYSYRVEELDKLGHKLGMPFLPLSALTTLVPVFPWLFYISMPAKITYVRGKTIRLYEQVNTPVEKLKKKEIQALRDDVQQQMQEELDAAVEQYGQDPYHWEDLGDTWRDNLNEFFYYFPSGWPVLFHEHERQLKAATNPANFQMDHSAFGFANACLKNMHLFSYMLPLVGTLTMILGHRTEEDL